MKQLAEQAGGDSDADAAKAVEQTQKLVREEPWLYRKPAGPVVKALMARHRYELADSLALEVILGAPNDWWYGFYMQSKRIDALLALGRKDAALAATKGLYNYANPRQFAQAVDVVCHVLKVAVPDGEKEAQRFRLQQQAWSVTPPAADSPLGAPVLASVHVDDKPFEYYLQSTLANMHRCQDMLGKGSALLLADRPTDAMKEFESAKAAAYGDKEIADVIDAIARAMRAQDQCMARANAYLASMRKEVTEDAGKP